MKFASNILAAVITTTATALFVVGCADPGHSHSTETIESCVVVDNDFDIDDMMAIPLVIGNRYVAAVIQSEGYTTPRESAPALDHFINHLPDQPNQRKIPVIVGGEQPQHDLSRWSWLPFFRSMMNQSNALLASAPSPWPADPAYPQKVATSVARCKSVSVLIIGTYTSFVNYSPLIRDKIDKVVIMGRPIGDNSRNPGRESFNCSFDMNACRRAMSQLQGLNAYFVDIPRDADVGGVCAGTLTPSPSCYNPSYEMVVGGNGMAGLLDAGLPGRLKQALTNPIDCSNKFTAGMPSIPGLAESRCSALSTWVPAYVSAGPGGEMLLWDQITALFLIHPEFFELYYPPQNPSTGGNHWEPVLLNGSYEQTIQRLRDLWTASTNRAAAYNR